MSQVPCVCSSGEPAVGRWGYGRGLGLSPLPESGTNNIWVEDSLGSPLGKEQKPRDHLLFPLPLQGPEATVVRMTGCGCLWSVGNGTSWETWGMEVRGSVNPPVSSWRGHQKHCLWGSAPVPWDWGSRKCLLPGRPLPAALSSVIQSGLHVGSTRVLPGIHACPAWARPGGTGRRRGLAPAPAQACQCQPPPPPTR